MSISERLEKKLLNEDIKEIKHNWTKETMGQCAKVHMEDIQHYIGLADPKIRLKKIEDIVKHYTECERTAK